MIPIILITIAAAFYFMMMARNNDIYKFTLTILESDIEAYKKLPPYNYMLIKFWVLDLNKFITNSEDKTEEIKSD